MCADHSLLKKAEQEGLTFIKAVEELEGLEGPVWTLPAHPLLQSSAFTQRRLPVNDGCIQVVDTRLNRDLERHLSDLPPAEPRKSNTDILGPTGAGKTTALYMAAVAVLKKNPNVRLLYVPHCSDWVQRGRQGKALGLLFFLQELMRAFARDPEVVTGLLNLAKKGGAERMLEKPMLLFNFVEVLNKFVKKRRLQLHAVLDAAEFLEESEKEPPFDSFTVLERCIQQCRVTRCGSVMQAYRHRHRQESEAWFSYVIAGSIGSTALSKLFAQLGFPFEEAHFLGLFQRICSITGGNPLELRHFADAWGLCSQGENLRARLRPETAGGLATEEGAQEGGGATRGSKERRRMDQETEAGAGMGEGSASDEEDSMEVDQGGANLGSSALDSEPLNTDVFNEVY
jgi:hypothetical protein